MNPAHTPVTTNSGRPRRWDESGAALIVALLFITIGSLVAVSLTNLTGTNLLNTSSLQAQRNYEYAADAATEGAIQSVRYHGSCENFSLKLATTLAPTTVTAAAINNYYSYVACTGLPSSVTATAGSSTLTAPTGTFVPEDVGQQVAFTCSTCTPSTLLFTTIQSVSSSSSATAAVAAPTTTDGAIVGNPFERTVVFSTCVSTSTLTSCSTTDAVISDVVQFTDLDNNGRSATGYSLLTLRWEVITAKG